MGIIGSKLGLYRGNIGIMEKKMETTGIIQVFNLSGLWGFAKYPQGRCVQDFNGIVAHRTSSSTRVCGSNPKP